MRGGALSFSLRRCKSRQKLIEGIFNSERHRGRSSDHNLKRATLANEAFSALSNNKGLDNVHASIFQSFPARVVFFRFVELASQSVGSIGLCPPVP